MPTTPTEPTGSGRLMPMFPLGTVLLPGMALPLRIFEPRYRQMLDDLAGGRFAERDEFGVVLIERGGEVGGGDQRSGLGCSARIDVLHRHDDGSAELLAVGERLIAVLEWLDDDPYPMALTTGVVGDALTDAHRLGELRDRVAAIVSMAFELRMTDQPNLPELDSDETAQVFQLALLLPIGAADRQRVLAAPSLSERIDLLHVMADDQSEILRAHLGR